MDKPQVLIDGESVIDDFFAQPALHITDNTLTAVFDVSNWLGEVDLTERVVNVTVSDTSFAEELSASVGAQPIVYENTTQGFWVMVGFALIGGLILNIMPCVLPVLGMNSTALSKIKVRQISTSDCPLSHRRQASSPHSRFWPLE